MPSHKVVKDFGSKEYYLGDITASRRSADASAKSYRDKGYLARVIEITNRRFGVWLRKEKKEGRG